MNRTTLKKYINPLRILIGCALDALGVAAFVLPSQIMVGGITGIARTIVHYSGGDISYVVAALSIGLLLLGWITVGKRFALTIVAGSLLYPLFLNLFNRSHYLTHMTENPLLAAIFGGVLIGAGLGLIIRAGASSGGSDVIAVILNKKLGIPIAPILYVIDFLVMLLQLPFSKIEDVLYGIMVILVYTIVLNRTVLIGSHNIQFTIISSKFREINEALQNLDVGTTLVHGATGHRGSDIDVIYCIVKHDLVHSVQKCILSIDPEAFMTTVAVNSVSGRGFTLDRQY